MSKKSSAHERWANLPEQVTSQATAWLSVTGKTVFGSSELRDIRRPTEPIRSLMCEVLREAWLDSGPSIRRTLSEARAIEEEEEREADE